MRKIGEHVAGPAARIRFAPAVVFRRERDRRVVRVHPIVRTRSSRRRSGPRGARRNVGVGAASSRPISSTKPRICCRRHHVVIDAHVLLAADLRGSPRSGSRSRCARPRAAAPCRRCGSSPLVVDVVVVQERRVRGVDPAFERLQPVAVLVRLRDVSGASRGRAGTRSPAARDAARAAPCTSTRSRRLRTSGTRRS